jgi:hypothetical protein
MLEPVIDAANGFVDFLFGTGTSSRVGEASFNFCYYDPPPTPPVLNNGQNQCISQQQHTIGLTDETAAAELHDTINSNIAWGGRNVCVGLLKAQELLSDARDDVKKTLLLLTDGDNNFNYNTSTATYPPPECRSIGPAQQSVVCSSAIGAELDMDTKTAALAAELKASGVEIYVIGFDVCGMDGLNTDDGSTQTTPGYCGAVGNGDNDRKADQRLLKCVASSPNHFFRVASDPNSPLPDLSDLPDVFRQIAAAMLGTRLLQ